MSIHLAHYGQRLATSNACGQLRWGRLSGPRNALAPCFFTARAKLSRLTIMHIQHMSVKVNESENNIQQPFQRHSTTTSANGGKRQTTVALPHFRACAVGPSERRWRRRNGRARGYARVSLRVGRRIVKSSGSAFPFTVDLLAHSVFLC